MHNETGDHTMDFDDNVVMLEAFADYQRAIGLSATTIRNRESILRTLSAATDTRLIDIQTAQLRRALGRQDVKSGSRRTYRGAYCAFYAFLFEDDYRADNPAARLAPVTAPKGTPRPFTRAQVDAMLVSGAYRRTRAMILLGYYQGFRVSQIARVHGRDIDRLTETIRTLAKGNKEGRVPLHPVIAELSESMPKDDWWFAARGGRTGHVHSSSVTNLITLAKIRAGIDDDRLTPHSLRHSFGTDLVDAGVDIRVVQELMLHSSLSTTQIYTGVSAQRKREAIASLAAMPIPLHSGRTTPDTNLPLAA